MLFSALLVLSFQTSASITIGKGAMDSAEIRRRKAQADTFAARQDSLRVIRDSVAAKRRLARKIPITPALLASAFRDPRARDLLERARIMRLTQDSALVSYDATAYERLSVDLQAGKWGRARKLFTNERASRIQWDRARGAVVDITGSRTAAPGDGSVEVNTGWQTPFPYFPGRDALWFGSGIAKADVTDDDLINPLANGAEAYYTYGTGDSMSFQMGGGTRITVRELLVRPRSPRSDVVVGSLWFEVASGQLVRAVYRLAQPIDVLATAKEQGDTDAGDDIPFLLRPLLTPMIARLDVMTIDYGLFEGRFWLPRVQILEGEGQVGPLQSPVSIQQRFEYASVNAAVTIPPIQLGVIDTGKTVEAYRLRREASERTCKDTSGEYTRSQSRYGNTLQVLVRVPCNTEALANSPSLPPAASSAADSMFDRRELDAMIGRALGLGSQSGFDAQPPKFRYGLPLTTYNRVEGLSTGAEITQVLGNGYTGRVLVRFGSADLRPKGEVALIRSNGRQTLSAAGYARIAAVNDWGNFFTVGSGLSAALFGRDEGMYYYTGGAELRYEHRGGLVDRWRLFLEEQNDARVHSSFSVVHAMRSSHRFQENVAADEGRFAGLELRRSFNQERASGRVRLSADVRAEGAVGTLDYSRGMADLTVVTPLVSALETALTLSAGTSGGDLPRQRLWFLGGTHTIRGHSIASAPGTVGNAYWLTRLELGRLDRSQKSSGSQFVRATLFGDLGWAGDRKDWLRNGRPISGAGVGISLLNGLLRYEMAKGISPNRSIRGYLYLDARF